MQTGHIENLRVEMACENLTAIIRLTHKMDWSGERPGAVTWLKGPGQSLREGGPETEQKQWTLIARMGRTGGHEMRTGLTRRGRGGGVEEEGVGLIVTQSGGHTQPFVHAFYEVPDDVNTKRLSSSTWSGRRSRCPQ